MSTYFYMSYVAQVSAILQHNLVYIFSVIFSVQLDIWFARLFEIMVMGNLVNGYG